MARKDITDRQVLLAYREREALMNLPENANRHVPYPEEILSALTGQCEKVCYRAMERAFTRGYLDYGMWLRGAWITEEGEEFLKQNRMSSPPPPPPSLPKKSTKIPDDPLL